MIQPPYNQQPYPYPYPPQRPTSGLAIAAMVLGIVGLTIGWCTLGIPAILAVIFGHISYEQTKTRQLEGKGMAVAGLVMGWVGVVPAVIILVMWMLGVIGSATGL